MSASPDPPEPGAAAGGAGAPLGDGDRTGARPPSALGLPAGLEAEGLGLAAALAGDVYDGLVPPVWQRAACAPEARSALLLASAGGRHFERFHATGGDSLDDYTRARVRALAEERGGRAFLYCDSREGVFADFVALGAAAGLGVPSRLGLLLHPEAGPWLAIRALLLVPEALAPTGPLVGFEPCTGCPAPCRTACPVAAPGPSGFRAERCGTHRRTGACATACDARRACPLGAAFAYPAAAEAWHQRAAAAWLRADAAGGSGGSGG